MGEGSFGRGELIGVAQRLEPFLFVDVGADDSLVVALNGTSIYTSAGAIYQTPISFTLCGGGPGRPRGARSPAPAVPAGTLGGGDARG